MSLTTQSNSVQEVGRFTIDWRGDKQPITIGNRKMFYLFFNIKDCPDPRLAILKFTFVTVNIMILRRTKWDIRSFIIVQ